MDEDDRQKGQRGLLVLVLLLPLLLPLLLLPLNKRVVVESGQDDRKYLRRRVTLC